MQTDLLRFLISLITFSVLLGTTALSQQLEYVHPKPTGTYFKDVTFVPDTDRVFAIADNSCLVYQSDDGGTSWSERCILPSPKAEDGFDQVFFVNAQIGFLVNNSGHIYRTEDAGATWTVAYDSIGCNMFDFEMNVNGIGVAAVNAGKIFYSDDFG
ncbi:MAG: hypothetical protein KTR24_14335, partial [Saprospiraceae bacterium]|nr:hypothetical protein [Saprospiraceae bacterium]